MQKKMTRSEGGKIGGDNTKKKYGKKYYVEIGQKGGETIKKKYGNSYYSELGKKGAKRIKELLEKGKAVEKINE